VYNYNTVISNFSGTPRPEQETAIKTICDIFKTKKFAIANIPTGVGKSHIAAAFCNSTKDISPDYASLLLSNEAFKKDYSGEYLHRHTIEQFNTFGGISLTTTKSLQNQYDALFDSGETLKGKSNYQCNVDGSYTVDVAPCLLSPKLKEQCLQNNTCSFYNQRSKALTSKFGILNYSVFLTLPDFIRKRQILICDEATEIEEVLVSKYSVDVSYAFLETENIPYTKLKSDTPSIAMRWLNDLYLAVNQIVNNLLEDVNLKSKKLSSTLFKDIKRLQKLTSFLESLSSVLSSWDKSEYIIEKKQHNVSYTPYNVDNLSKDLFDSADHVILMGAFLPKKTIEFLGIKPQDYEFFELNSPFNSKKSPIYCSNKYALSYNTMEKLLPKVIDQAITICDGYSKEKGVVHTHSMQITEAFQNKVKSNSRFLFREHGTTNESIILQHKTLKDMPTVVVSPSVAFGVSFDDDEGRFQIILKAPYMPLSSKRIKLIFEREPSYYQIKMLINLLQMCGRCTRNSEDFSATFILDATICKVLHKEVDKLPKYFLDRFV
jgi:Rad3-related DNA helicase